MLMLSSNQCSYLYSMAEIESFSFLKDSCSLGISLRRIVIPRAGLIKALLMFPKSSMISLISGEIFVPLIFLSTAITSRALCVIVVTSNFASPIFSNIELRLELPSLRLYLKRNACIVADQSVISRNAWLCRLLIPVNELNVFKRAANLPTLALYQHVIEQNNVHTQTLIHVQTPNIFPLEAMLVKNGRG
jgi:hypothetical protein